MGPTSYVSFRVPHKVSSELWTPFQAYLKKSYFFYDSGHIFWSTKILFMQNQLIADFQYFSCGIIT